MQINHKTIIASLLAGASLLVACKKTEERTIPEQMNLGGKATVKVYNATLNSVRNNVYIDNMPITGSSGVYGFGAAFPNTVYGFSVEPGTRTVLIKDTTVGTRQTEISFQGNFEAGKVYTIFTYDTLTAAKYKMVETPIAQPDNDTSARLRFANFVHHTAAIPNVDVFSKRRNANVFSNIPVTGVTDFVSYPAGIVDSFFVRAAGTLGPDLDTLSFVPTVRRSYTLVFRGRYLANNHPTLSRTLSPLANY